MYKDQPPKLEQRVLPFNLVHFYVLFVRPAHPLVRLSSRLLFTGTATLDQLLLLLLLAALIIVHVLVAGRI